GPRTISLAQAVPINRIPKVSAPRPPGSLYRMRRQPPGWRQRGPGPGALIPATPLCNLKEAARTGRTSGSACPRPRRLPAQRQGDPMSDEDLTTEDELIARVVQPAAVGGATVGQDSDLPTL